MLFLKSFKIWKFIPKNNTLQILKKKSHFNFNSQLLVNNKKLNTFTKKSYISYFLSKISLSQKVSVFTLHFTLFNKIWNVIPIILKIFFLRTLKNFSKNTNLQYLEKKTILYFI